MMFHGGSAPNRSGVGRWFSLRELRRFRYRRRADIVRSAGSPSSLREQRHVSSPLRWRSSSNWVRTGNGRQGRASRSAGRSGTGKLGDRRRGFFVRFRGRRVSFPPCLIQSADGVFEMSGVLGDREFLVRSDHHHQIVAARPLGPMESKCLAKQPFETVSTDGVSASPTDGEPQTEMIGLVREGIHEERAGFATSSCSMNRGEGASAL
jgi:hypothetical protein